MSGQGGERLDMAGQQDGAHADAETVGAAP